MKGICKNCSSSHEVNEEIKKASLEVQAIQKKPIRKIQKAEEIGKIKNIGQIAETKGSAIIHEKPNAIQSEFIKCSNVMHLIDEKATGEEKSIVHKYYFKCPHFKSK